MMTHDGIVGYWVPKPGFNIPVPPPVTGKGIGYLTRALRRQLLKAIIASQFTVSNPADGVAELHLGSQAICKLLRPAMTVFEAQLEFVANYAELRADRSAEIQAQAHSIMGFFAGLAPLGRPHLNKTMDILIGVHSAAILLEMQVKHYCLAPRPMDFAPQIYPIIETPSHSSFPSGHSTESFAIATVLHFLMTGQKPLTGMQNWAMPFRLAHRIAVNRTVAGVHFPVDSAAGALLGCSIGQAVINLLMGEKLSAFAFDGTFDGDFTSTWLTGALAAAQTGAASPAAPAVLKDHWTGVLEEWRKQT